MTEHQRKALRTDSGYLWVQRMLMNMPCTLDGRPAHVAPASFGGSALVWQRPIDGDLATSAAVELSWADVQRIMAAGGTFSSAGRRVW